MLLRVREAAVVLQGSFAVVALVRGTIEQRLQGREVTGGEKPMIVGGAREHETRQANDFNLVLPIGHRLAFYLLRFRPPARRVRVNEGACLLRRSREMKPPGELRFVLLDRSQGNKKISRSEREELVQAF